MVDEFTIESRTIEVIKVRHVAHRHRFTFHISELPYGRRLRAGLIEANDKAPLPSLAFKARARIFAEREARKADLID
jgi:hypothetical protein